jgi:hypothetical protein
MSRMTRTRVIPPDILNHFRDRHFLFLGYGLRDWNLRVLLNNLRQDLNKSWAIDLYPSELETRLWRSRSVNIFQLSIDDFVANLRKEKAKRP